MIDVAKLINTYCSQVNPKVNVLVFKAQDTIMLLCRSTVIVPTYCMVGQVRKSSLQMKWFSSGIRLMKTDTCI